MANEAWSGIDVQLKRNAISDQADRATPAVALPRQRPFAHAGGRRGAFCPLPSAFGSLVPVRLQRKLSAHSTPTFVSPR
ncbi:MAG: hypothetical protein WBM31_20450, partial [Pseudolabrys sp.]